MPKETERQIKSETQYFSHNGQIYKKVVTTYSLISGAGIREENDDNPTVEEFKDVILNKDDSKSNQGYVVK